MVDSQPPSAEDLILIFFCISQEDINAFAVLNYRKDKKKLFKATSLLSNSDKEKHYEQAR